MRIVVQVLVHCQFFEQQVILWDEPDNTFDLELVPVQVIIIYGDLAIG
jgi:ABC-type histidine transport system ATPase subunit